MTIYTGVIAFLLFLLIGSIASTFYYFLQYNNLQKDLEYQKKNYEEKLSSLKEVDEKLNGAFKQISSELLSTTSSSFLALAEERFEKLQTKSQSELLERQKSITETLKPIESSIKLVDQKMIDFDKGHRATFHTLSEQLRGMGVACASLHKETSNLVKALRQPHVRGRWGEVQLKRVVELAGMVPYCDFIEQSSADVDEKRHRPDLIVRLPNNRQVVVDAKTPMHSYLEAMETTDDAFRVLKMKDHARQVRQHIQQLSGKAYWEQFNDAPEFVVLFIPGESFFSAALEQDPTLIEQGVLQKVILATPTTLIALLRAISHGWRQESLAVNAEEISQLGKELYKRLGGILEHFEGLRSGLQKAVDGYNKAMGTFESRVLVTARKFEALDVARDSELEMPKTIETKPKELRELVEFNL